MIKKVDMGFISSFRVGSGRVTVSHLQFVDDTMIFCHADVRQMGYLRCILRCYKAVSGLKNNLAKSGIFQVGDDCDIESFAWFWGCKIGSLPSSY